MMDSAHTQGETLGLIAGNRSLPMLFAQEAKAAGIKRLVAVGFHNETNPALESMVDELVWVRVGQLNKMIHALTSRRVTRCVMLGQIAPGNLFDLRPDWRALKLLMRIREKNAHTLFGAVADELDKDGIKLIEPTPWLASSMPSKGFHLGPALSQEQMKDVDYGYAIAKAVSELEIGQTVVVKKGTVLAVEGFEGTDRCLSRGGELAGTGRGAVAVKVAKKNHDFRFDIPCIGPDTLKVCAQAGIAVLAVESGRAILLDKEIMSQMAKTQKIAITTIG